MQSTEQPFGHELWRNKRFVAEFYGYSTRWVERQVASGMPSLRIGGQLRFRLSVVEDWVAAQPQGAS